MNLLLNEETDLQKLIFDAEYLVERRSPKALPLAKRAMQLAIRSTNPQYFIYAKYILAFYYSLVKNDYDKSIEICTEVLDAMGEEGNEISYKIYMTLGNSYQLKGDIFAAQESYMKGLKQLEARKKLNSRETGFLASLYYNLSLLLSSAEINISSDEYLQKAIEIYKQVENGFKLSKCYVA
jgi:tetratricopeptide (TPR) repeat protein